MQVDKVGRRRLVSVQRGIPSSPATGQSPGGQCYRSGPLRAVEAPDAVGCLLYPSFFSLGCSNQPQTSEAYHREGSFLSLLRVGGRGSALLSSLCGSRLSADPTLMCPLVAERREDTLTSRCFVRRLLPGSAVTSAPTPSAKAQPWPPG